MVKNLVSRLGKGIRKAFLIGTAVATIGLATACPNPIPPVPVPDDNDNSTTPIHSDDNGDDASNDEGDTSTPPYISTIDFSSVDTDLDEEKEKTLTLPEYDIEGNPVTYTGKTYNEEKFDLVDLNENELTLKGRLDIYGDYQIELHFKDYKGQTNTATLEGIIHNMLDISGQLQDNETDSNQVGVIAFYNIDKNPLPIDIIYEGNGIDGQEHKLQTNSNLDNVNFSIQLNARVDNLDEILLQARIGTPGNYTSYVRTVRLNEKKDYFNISPVYPIRVVPYPDSSKGEDFSEEDFRKHMEEVNFASSSIGCERWNLEELQGIEIIEENPFNGVTFSNEEILLIKNKIQDINDIRIYIEGRELYIDEFSEKHYKEDFINKIITPDQGWIVVVPVLQDITHEYENDTEIPYDGLTFLYDHHLTGYIRKAKILLWEKTNTVISHEFGHALAFPYEAYTLKGDKTIMYWSPILPSPSPADKKAAYIIYEGTYNPGEKLDDILRLNWGF